MFKKILKAIGNFYNAGYDVVPVTELQAQTASEQSRVPAQPKVAEGFLPPARVDQGTPAYRGVPVPKYPDHGWAVPAATPQDLIDTQSDLIREIHQASGLSHDDFHELLLPVINNYACFVHLLPASENHHHSAQGGLFRHGLEVAYYAARRCEGKVFALDHPASIRKHLEPRWVICAILGGLMHDVGKPQVDVGAVNDSGEKVWDPYRESLYAWLARNRMNHYFILWKSGARHRRHEARTIYAIDRMIPQTTRDWLAAYHGQAAVDAMIDALAGSTDIRNPLITLIKKADSDSVSRDVAESRNRLSASGSGGVRSLAARIIRVMHDQLASGEWKLNTIGHSVWITDEGVFAEYPSACIKAIEVLREEGDKGLPNDASQVMDVLREYGFLMENNLEEGRSYSTWHGDVHTTERGKDLVVPMHGMRFLHSPIVPNSIIIPEPVHIDLMNASGKILNPQQAEEPVAEDPPESILPANPDQLAPMPQRDEVEPEQAGAEGSVPGGVSTDEPVVDEDDSLPPPPKSPGQLATEERAASAVVQVSVDEEVRDEGAEGTEDDPALRDRRSERDVRDELIESSQRQVNGSWPPRSSQEAREWFETQIPEGPILAEVADRAQKQQLIMGLDIIDGDDYVHIRYPQAFQQLGIPASEIPKMLEAKGWSERDPATPGKGAVTLIRGEQKVNTIRLTEHISKGFRKLLPETGEQTHRATPKAFPLGPYIDEAMASLIQSKEAPMPADAPFIRLAFGNYVDAVTRNKPDSSDRFGPKAMATYISDFAREHHLRKAMVIRNLTGYDNPYLVEAEGKSKSRHPQLVGNESYDREKDDVIVKARIGQMAGGTS